MNLLNEKAVVIEPTAFECAFLFDSFFISNYITHLMSPKSNLLIISGCLGVALKV